MASIDMVGYWQSVEDEFEYAASETGFAVILSALKSIRQSVK